MPQRDQLFPWRTIRDNVTLGLTVTKKRTPETLAYADALLKRYGLWEFAGKRPSQLSGGMRQPMRPHPHHGHKPENPAAG